MGGSPRPASGNATGQGRSSSSLRIICAYYTGGGDCIAILGVHMVVRYGTASHDGVGCRNRFRSRGMNGVWWNSTCVIYPSRVRESNEFCDYPGNVTDITTTGTHHQDLIARGSTERETPIAKNSGIEKNATEIARGIGKEIPEGEERSGQGTIVKIATGKRKEAVATMIDGRRWCRRPSPTFSPGVRTPSASEVEEEKKIARRERTSGRRWEPESLGGSAVGFPVGERMDFWMASRAEFSVS